MAQSLATIGRQDRELGQFKVCRPQHTQQRKARIGIRMSNPERHTPLFTPIERKVWVVPATAKVHAIVVIVLRQPDPVLFGHKAQRNGRHHTDSVGDSASTGAAAINWRV